MAVHVFTVIEPFWSDGVSKARYFAIPDDATIEVNDEGDFLFPTGTVLLKNFFLDQEIIETRLFMRGDAGNWIGYSYQWNATKTDALLVTGGSDVDIHGQTWHYPSTGECSQCHTSAAGHSLGLETAQLKTDFTYPQTGITANQLDTLEAIGIFSESQDNSVRELKIKPDNPSLEQQARAYLHSNCANCHRPGGTSQSTMDWRFTTELEDTNACDAEPLNGDLGVADARLIKPGDADGSLVYLRMIDEGESDAADQ